MRGCLTDSFYSYKLHVLYLNNRSPSNSALKRLVSSLKFRVSIRIKRFLGFLQSNHRLGGQWSLYKRTLFENLASRSNLSICDIINRNSVKIVITELPHPIPRWTTKYEPRIKREQNFHTPFPDERVQKVYITLSLLPENNFSIFVGT